MTGHLAASDVALDGLRLQVAILQGNDASQAVDPQRLLDRLQHLSITDAQAEITFGTPGQTVTVTDAAAEVARASDGVLHGHAAATAASGGAAVHAELQGSYGPAGGAVQATIPSINPAVLARAVPALAAAGALDTDMALRGEATLGPGLSLQHASLHADAGSGTVQLPKKGGGNEPRPVRIGDAGCRWHAGKAHAARPEACLGPHRPATRRPTS